MVVKQGHADIFVRQASKFLKRLVGARIPGRHRFQDSSYLLRVDRADPCVTDGGNGCRDDGFPGANYMSGKRPGRVVTGTRARRARLN